MADNVSLAGSVTTVSTMSPDDVTSCSPAYEFVKGLACRSGLWFEKSSLEEKYRAQRYGDTRVTIAMGAILGVLYGIMPMANFSAAIFHETPDNYYTTNETQSPWIHDPVGFFFAGSGLVMMAVAMFLLFRRECVLKGEREQPCMAEWMAGLVYFALSLVPCATRQSTIPLFCDPKGSLLRSNAAGEVGKTCDQFFEPYYLTVTALVFTTSPRAIFTIPFFPFLMGSYFAGRKILGGNDFLLWSEYVFLVYTVAVMVLLWYIEREDRKLFVEVARVESVAKEAAGSHREVDALLAALLPSNVLQRLLSGEQVADSAEVTIMYADVVKFTKWCSARFASDIVSHLDNLYRTADAALARPEFRSVTKIKTIGDAYWAMCGLPEKNTRHATIMCAFALWMRDDVQSNCEFPMRFGLHSGPAAAGVIGLRQLSYEPYGSTNELAEVVEAFAPSNKILITAATKLLLSDDENTEATVLDYGVVPYGLTNVMTFLLQDMVDISGESSPRSWSRRASRSRSVVVVEDDKVSQGRRFLLERHNRRSANAPQGGQNPLGQRPQRRLPAAPRPANVAAKMVRSGAELRSEAASKALTELRSKLKRRFTNAWVPVDDYASREFESKFRAECREDFVITSHVSNAFCFVIFAVIYILTFMEDRPHPIESHVLRTLGTLLPMFLFIFPRAIPPRIAFFALYLELYLQLAGALLMNPSFASNELSYVSVIFALITMCRGTPIFPWVVVVALNFALISLPAVIVNEVEHKLRLHHIFHPVTLLAPWIVATRRQELRARANFEARNLARLISESARAESNDLRTLLHQIVPKFVIRPLQRWFADGRSGYIAGNHPGVGVMFIRIPEIAQATVLSEPRALMDRVAVVSRSVDMTIVSFPEVLKLKTIGDITLVVSGVDESTYDENSRKGRRSELDAHRNSGFLGEDDELPDVHLVSLLQAALLLTDLLDLRDSVKPHIGVHVGPVTCGVIGTERPIFDAFGDAVNVASRVASTTLAQLGSTDASTSTHTMRPVWVSEDFMEAFQQQLPAAGVLAIMRRAAGASAGADANPYNSLFINPSTIASMSSGRGGGGSTGVSVSATAGSTVVVPDELMSSSGSTLGTPKSTPSKSLPPAATNSILTTVSSADFGSIQSSVFHSGNFEIPPSAKVVAPAEIAFGEKRTVEAKGKADLEVRCAAVPIVEGAAHNLVVDLAGLGAQSSSGTW